MKTFMRTVAGIALLAGMSAAPAYANLITNGSFEDGSPQPGPAGNALFVGNTDITGWTVTGSDPSHSILWLTNTGNVYGLSTPYGSNFLDLTGSTDSVPYDGVSQQISTTVGQHYALTFSLGVDQGSTIGPYGGPVGVTASAGTTNGSFLGYNPPGTGNMWKSYTLDFVADSLTTTINITGAQGVQYTGLDNVAVNAISAVPLPASAPMFGAALVALSVVGYGLKRNGKIAGAA